MITIDELKTKLGGMKTAVDDLRDALSIEASEKRLAELEHQMTMPGFYDDQARSQKVISEMGEVKNKLERFGKPGKTLIGSDSHTPTGGGIGMLAFGAGTCVFMLLFGLLGTFLPKRYNKYLLKGSTILIVALGLSLMTKGIRLLA